MNAANEEEEAEAREVTEEQEKENPLKKDLVFG